MPDVIERMRARIALEASPGLQHELWAATFLLMGLRYEGELIVRLLAYLTDHPEELWPASLRFLP